MAIKGTKKDAAFACRVRLLRGAAHLKQGAACDFSLIIGVLQKFSYYEEEPQRTQRSQRKN